jgi:putative phosphoribosyl transferase
MSKVMPAAGKKRGKFGEANQTGPAMITVYTKAVHIGTEGPVLAGDLCVPERASCIVLFAHGSGSSRHSPRNRQVAHWLQQTGIGTLLLDLLTPAEDEDYDNRFNIPLLTNRLMAATRWLQHQPEAAGRRIAYFGASTGAAAALGAAAQLPGQIAAVVSRGGRPDMAMDSLPQVQAPTLLMIGSLDPTVLQLNGQALQALQCPKKLAIIDGATHLFEEPGKLHEVALLATAWFQYYCTPISSPASTIRL